MLNEWLNAWRNVAADRHRFGEEDISICSVPLGVQGEIGMIVLGCERADFPSQTESLLLSVAANQASSGYMKQNS